jgi:hypothetical protein
MELDNEELHNVCPSPNTIRMCDRNKEVEMN